MQSLLLPLSVFPLSPSTLKQHRWRLSLFLSWNWNLSSARKSVTICRYATDRKLHPSKLVNRQRALSHSECIDRHPQGYTSIFYSSPQLGCHVTLCKVSVHPQLLVIMLWLYNATGWVWRWKTLGTHASRSVTIFNKNYNLKVWLFWNKVPYGTGLP